MLETILSVETYRAEMAVEMLTERLHEQRAVVSLTLLSEYRDDDSTQVWGVRGLGWLGARASVPTQTKALLAKNQSYVTSVAAAASWALQEFPETEWDIQP